MAHQAKAYPGFRSMKRIRVFLLSPGWPGMLVHRRLSLSIKLTSTILYTWLQRGTVRVKCFAQEQTQCPWPGLEPAGPLNPESAVWGFN